MEKYKADFKLKVVESFLAGEGGAKLLAQRDPEMLGVSAGMGYFILDTRDRLAYDELMAGIVVIGGLGFALDVLARTLCKRWTRTDAPE